MARAKSVFGLWLTLFLASCVTINVYFPAAAAEKAADKIIDEVWGKESGQPAAPRPEPRSLRSTTSPWLTLLDIVFPAAYAQADLDITSPAIKRIEASMKARHQALRPFYAAGAVYLTRDGLIAVRDAKVVPLKDRKALKSLVAAENRDRVALYKEIARANNRPEWESNIRATFARRWVSRAEPGWWYDLGRGPQQKR